MPAAPPSPPTATGVGWRLAACYVAYFVALALYLPYWPLWLTGRGCSETDIGLLMASGVFARTLAGPWIGQRCDRRGARRPAVRALALLACAAAAAFAAARSFAGLLWCTVAFMVTFAPMLALVESTAVLAEQRGLARYGMVRTQGSLAFLLVVLLAGPRLRADAADMLQPALLLATAMLAVACWWMPEMPSARADGRGPLRALIADRRFVWFVLATGAIHGSHAAFNAYSALHWQRCGHAPGAVAVLWGTGVAAEIALFVGARRGGSFAARWSVSTVLMATATVAVLRWAITATSAQFAVLLSVQATHALTYGATHLVSIRFLATEVAEHQGSTAQSVYGSVSLGLMIGLSLLLASALAATSVPAAFAGMAALAVAGGGCAAAMARCRRVSPA